MNFAPFLEYATYPTHTGFHRRFECLVIYYVYLWGPVNMQYNHLPYKSMVYVVSSTSKRKMLDAVGRKRTYNRSVVHTCITCDQSSCHLCHSPFFNLTDCQIQMRCTKELHGVAQTVLSKIFEQRGEALLFPQKFFIPVSKKACRHTLQKVVNSTRNPARFFKYCNQIMALSSLCSSVRIHSCFVFSIFLSFRVGKLWFSLLSFFFFSQFASFSRTPAYAFNYAVTLIYSGNLDREETFFELC